ncbi:hypothetical protein V8G54_023061 [Vigna mungo]|uniref:Uncharacterized protein n=1 Tax=Vigna mungo TaxID=3915 RepID=A0AAQ3N451_VIGMU
MRINSIKAKKQRKRRSSCRQHASHPLVVAGATSGVAVPPAERHRGRKLREAGLLSGARKETGMCGAMIGEDSDNNRCCCRRLWPGGRTFVATSSVVAGYTRTRGSQYLYRVF